MTTKDGSGKDGGGLYVRESLDPTATLPGIPRAELSDIYRLFIEEYRFQTRFNWDRIQYFFVLNSAIIAVGATLMKDGATSRTKPLLGFVFLLGFATALFAIQVARKGDEYYRRVVLKKTVVEQLLGRFDRLPGFKESLNLSLGTTVGMSESDEILRDPENYLRRGWRSGNIKYSTVSLLRLFAGINALGYLYSLVPDVLLERWLSTFADLLG
jgi:hypothetical protein